MDEYTSDSTNALCICNFSKKQARRALPTEEELPFFIKNSTKKYLQDGCTPEEAERVRLLLFITYRCDDLLLELTKKVREAITQLRQEDKEPIAHESDREEPIARKYPMGLPAVEAYYHGLMNCSFQHAAHYTRWLDNLIQAHVQIEKVKGKVCVVCNDPVPSDTDSASTASAASPRTVTFPENNNDTQES